MGKNVLKKSCVGILTAAALAAQGGNGQFAAAAEWKMNKAEVFESGVLMRDRGCTPSDVLEESAASDGEAAPEKCTPSNGESVAPERTPSNAARPDKVPLASAIGDLWGEWHGDMEFAGDGTKSAPYQIGTLSQLMGLSEAVASGTSFAGVYLELTEDLDLGSIDINGGNWNPIGWYRDSSELSGPVKKTFQGHFDGRGHTVTGLKIINMAKPLGYVGLFGVIDGGSVRNLRVEADDIYGDGCGGVLAGEITGSAQIHDVEVTGYVSAKGDIGGIAGRVTGGTEYAVIENCKADGIVLNGRGKDSFTGGIAGNVQRANLVDNTAITQDGDANRIRGIGTVGGIAGRMNLTNLYNSYVSGTIGGNGSSAVGGIVGKYESGNLILARFAGDISRTNNGSASHEGTFVGTRDRRNQFTYGTEKHNNLSFLYTTSGAMARRVFGSNIDGDNAYTKDAHIGYWTDFEKKYVTVAGTTETGCKDRYFYEELEDGVRYLVTQKLGREYTAGGYDKGLPFRLDHFAPGYQGEPVRGYLVSVPRIDAKNSNGTYDTDVATLTAIPVTNNSWYRQIDKDHPAAIAPGEIVSVATAPKNQGENRYQMIYDETEEGKVKPPVYLDASGEQIPMGYVNGGFYSFEMPVFDTELSAEYRKVTTKLKLDPDRLGFHVTQTRSGDRKRPSLVTEVKDDGGVLIARYIDGVADSQVEVQPVAIHAAVNSSGASSDRTVCWSVDDKNLLTNLSEQGYTEKDARIIPNLDAAFIQDIIIREVMAQADQGYVNPISNTIYTKSAVVSASTNPETSVDHLPVVGNCRVDVNFQILDYTTVRVEGLNLNKSQIFFTITRKLTGSRRAPAEQYMCSEPVVLTANLYPSQPFYKNVAWRDGDNSKTLQLIPKGSNTQDCEIRVRYDPAGKDNPAWIQNVIFEDDAKKAAQGGMIKLEGAAEHKETVTASSEDQTHGHLTAVCEVVARFVTVDETVVGGGSGGSSGGSSGGGGGSVGVTPAGSKTSFAPPAGAVTGTWIQTADSRWTFSADGRTYNNEWAYIHNPYAEVGQPAADWFRFSETGHMMTGWYSNQDGQNYYLNPVSDNTLGRMVTGWKQIEGKHYYFNIMSDGTKGRMLQDTVTPDGYRVNVFGVWEKDQEFSIDLKEKG